ncbi:MAG: ATP-binding cassette domain-containing protein [Gemmatimonas sp.]
MNALAFESVSHTYGARRALDRVSFSVAPGEFAVLLGLNGAGKTTLFALASGLLPLQTGRVSVAGHPLPRRRGAALAHAGFVFQQSALDLDLTVAETLRYHAALHGQSRAEARRRIAAELDRFGLADRARDPVRTLSGGQRRRVEIARALLHGPQVLLLDEPTVGLDVPSRKAILDRCHALCRERGAAVLWATHLLDEVTGDDRVVVLHAGRVIADGRADALAGAEPFPRRFSAMIGVEAA